MATGTLIKRKPSKQTEVWEFEDFFRKKWMFKDEAWLAEHIKMLKEIGPVGYLKGHGADDNTMWIDTFKIKGQLATTFPQSPEFIEKVTDYCLEHYNKTKPYAHFDWELSNMIIDNDNITLLDWDNCAIYPEGQIIDKMDADFKKAFADKFDSEQFRKRIASETKTLPKKAPTEKLKFVLELYSEYWKNPPIAEIYVNQESKFKASIKGTKDNPDVITFEHEFTEGETWELMIDRYNKSEKETNFVDGKILNDQLLYIKNVEIDEINIGAIVYEFVYKPRYPVRWAQQQKEAGNVLPKTLKNATILGHNGTWTLQLKSPFYMWLLENLY